MTYSLATNALWVEFIDVWKEIQIIIFLDLHTCTLYNVLHLQDYTALYVRMGLKYFFSNLDIYYR